MADSSQATGMSILEDFLNSTGTNTDTSSTSIAAEAAAKSLLTAYDNQLQAIGSVVLKFAQDQSSDSLLEQLAQIPPALQAQSSSEDYQQFGWAVREAWNYSDPGDDNPDQAIKREQWRRLNAFAALLAAQGDSSVLLNGLWTLRTALEDEDSVEGTLPAAAMWMICAGEVIWDSGETFEFRTASGRDPAKPGRTFQGPSGFSSQRWAFWKDGFERARSDSRLSESTKQWAGKAADAMSAVMSKS